MAKAPRSLAGRVVAITGGGRGIGRATAAALVARGARVGIGDIEAPLAQQTAEQLGSGTIGLPLDVTNRESFTTFLDDIESRLGPLDVLINNAGIMPIGPFVAEPDATAKRLVDINVHGVIFGSKLALERFSTRGRGHLVNIASIVGKSASPHLATYVATKHAVVGLTEALRLEYADTGIDFTVVMPVGVNTELYSGLQPLRGMKTPEPEEVADAIVEALQTGRYEVYIPKRMNAFIRSGALLPRKAMDSLGKAVGGDTVTRPDRGVRAAYEQRIAQTPAAAQPSDAEPEAETPPPAEQQEPATEPSEPATEPSERATETV
jgi:NAD(P)-dependent dehydrogenase (short-subunit alcohol dehydrogenase family)